MARATKLRIVGGKTPSRLPPKPAKGGLAIGAACPNCGSILGGAWCATCGQKGEHFHRSIGQLGAESLEGLTHVDSRFWNTVPRLVLNPGQLTREYLDGKRASQVPPFRMFLIILLIVFFTGSLNFKPSTVSFDLKPLDSVANRLDQTEYRKIGDAISMSSVGHWIMQREQVAMRNPEAFFKAMERWAHQFAILMLPIGAALLSILFAFKRNIYVYDHLIFTMHSLAFQGLLLAVIFLASLANPWAYAFFLLAPVHIFFHMRGTYHVSVVGALIRMFFLGLGTATGFTLLMLSLVLVGLAQTH